MLPTILPEIVRCNLGPMRHALDAYEARDLTPEQADEFFFLCSFLADAIAKSWATIQGDARKGIEGRKLSARLQELSGQIEEAQQTYTRLRKKVRAIPDGPSTAAKPSRLTTDIERLEQVRQQSALLLEWVNAPSPPLDVERLKTLEAGPFVRLADLKARHASPAS
jgi:hypothetical protein